ncbi:MAG: PASTA domain-containing protein [Pyrinomonadaceae bacterium]
MGIAKRALLSLGRIGIIIGVAIAFFLGLAGTVYLSLRTSEVKVPDLIGKDRMTGESTLSDAGLNIRVRATRPATDAKPDTILAQLPHAGEVVKVGQTVAVDVSRAAKEGESTISASTVMEENKKDEKAVENANAADSEKNLNDNREKRKKPVNKNANNSNTNDANANDANNASNRNANNRNANNANANSLYGNRETNTRNANQLNTNARNTNGIQNANANRATNANIRNTNAGNTNRGPNTLNINRRTPNVSTPTLANPNANRRTTP